MEEKITSTAAQTFRNLKRMRAVVEAVRELASEVDAEGATNTPAEELPGVISEGIVSRIAALEDVCEEVVSAADSAFSVASSAKATADSIKADVGTANTMAGEALNNCSRGDSLAEDAYWNTVHILDRIENTDISLTLRGRLKSGSESTTYKFDNSEEQIYPIEADADTGIFSITVPSKPQTCERMFVNNKDITTIETMPDLSECTNMFLLFHNCTNLSRVNTGGWNTSAVTNMVNVFAYCSAIKELDVSSLDLSNAERLAGMFLDASSIKRLDLSKWTTTPVLWDLTSMFQGMSVLEELDLSGLDTSGVNQFGFMLSGCSMLNTLRLGLFDMENTNGSGGVVSMFRLCKSLANVTGEIRNLAFSLDLSYCPLTNESAMVFINGLAEVSEPQTIKFRTVSYQTLTDEQIAIATSKGWSVEHASPYN